MGASVVRRLLHPKDSETVPTPSASTSMRFAARSMAHGLADEHVSYLMPLTTNISNRLSQDSLKDCLCFY